MRQVSSWNNSIVTMNTGFALIILSSALSIGCATTSLTSDVDPQADLSSLESFLVVKLPADNRGIEDLIARALDKRGKTAMATASRPDQVDADAVVTYQDKWMWDITMYMLELNVEIRHPRTDYVLATGRSFRTSLARKSPEEMVEEVIGEIFGE